MSQCVSPPALEDWQLLAWLDGEAAPEIAAHLAECPSCRERASALDRLQKDLAARLYRLSCPTPEELGDFHLGLLRGEQADAIRVHLRTCPHCQEEIRQLRTYLSELVPPARAGSF